MLQSTFLTDEWSLSEKKRKRESLKKEGEKRLKKFDISTLNWNGTYINKGERERRKEGGRKNSCAPAFDLVRERIEEREVEICNSLFSNLK